MVFNQDRVKRILVVSLSNIGDVILTFPVVDVLRESYPRAEISLVCGPKAASLFHGDNCFQEVCVFDKQGGAFHKLGLIGGLFKKRFNLTVDLRNSAIPFLCLSQKATPIVFQKKEGEHARDRHLRRLSQVLSFNGGAEKKYAISFSDHDTAFIEKMILEEFEGMGRYILIAPGAAAFDKRWPVEKFAELADLLIRQHHVRVGFVGDESDSEVAHKIFALMKEERKAANLCGKTSLRQLAALMTRAKIIVSNDSAPMHLASYLDRPVVGLFGPSDERQYGPWSSESLCLTGMNSLAPGKVLKSSFWQDNLQY